MIDWIGHLVSWIDAFGHLAYFLLFMGTFLVGRKQTIGWVLYIVGDLIWLGIGWELRMSSIITWQAAFMILGIRNWYLWRSEEVEDEDQLSQK